MKTIFREDMAPGKMKENMKDLNHAFKTFETWKLSSLETDGTLFEPRVNQVIADQVQEDVENEVLKAYTTSLQKCRNKKNQAHDPKGNQKPQSLPKNLKFP